MEEQEKRRGKQDLGILKGVKIIGN